MVNYASYCKTTLPQRLLSLFTGLSAADNWLTPPLLKPVTSQFYFKIFIKKQRIYTKYIIKAPRICLL